MTAFFHVLPNSFHLVPYMRHCTSQILRCSVIKQTAIKIMTAVILYYICQVKWFIHNNLTSAALPESLLWGSELRWHESRLLGCRISSPQCRKSRTHTHMIHPGFELQNQSLVCGLKSWLKICKSTSIKEINFLLLDSQITWQYLLHGLKYGQGLHYKWDS